MASSWLKHLQRILPSTPGWPLGLGYLLQTKLVDAYRGRQGTPVRGPMAHPGRQGWTTVEILPELTRLPLCDLVLAFVGAFEPSEIRVVTGEETTDSCNRRVTIYVDAQDVVLRITQERFIYFGTGAEIGTMLQQMQQRPAFRMHFADVVKLLDDEAAAGYRATLALDWLERACNVPIPRNQAYLSESLKDAVVSLDPCRLKPV